MPKQRASTYLAYIRVSTNEQGAGLDAQRAPLDGSPPPTRDVGTHRRSPTKPFWLHFTEVGAELRGTPPDDGQTGSLTFFNRTLFGVPIPPMEVEIGAES
jgi:hypothetical protein